MTGSLHEYVCKFMTVDRKVLLRMRNVTDKNLRENQNMFFFVQHFFFTKSCRLWNNFEKKKMVEPDRQHMTI